MKVLITGSAGFVGRNLIDHLAKDTANRAYEISTADIVGRPIRINSLPSTTLGPDLAKEDVAFRVQEQAFDVIVHLASSVSTPGSLEHPFRTFRDTVRTAVNVLEGARRTRTPVILTSSVKARDPVRTPYGTAKRMVEMWAEEYQRAYGMTIVINRPGTIYGPGQEGSPESGWVAWFLEAKREGLPIVIDGDGKQMRDLLHVSDYCRLLERQLIEPEFYAERQMLTDPIGHWDVGGGMRNAVSIKEMADHLGLEYTHGPERYGDSRVYVGYNDVPGWEPEVFWPESEVFRG